MMIHKIPSKTGVADYFAILGIDSFASASHDDTVTNCDEMEELDTPKSANLTATVIDSQCNHNGGINEMEKKEEQMHLQRFHREITHLALLSQHVDELDDKWTICQSNHTTPSDDALNKLHLYGAPLHISGMQCDSVQIAHQTRGQHQNDANSPSTADSTSTNDGEYYIPAVADVSIQYAKVHPLSIPNYTYPSQQQQQKHSQETYNDQPKLPTIVAAAAAAKTLTSFARKTTVLGKEIVGEGLVSVVKNVRGAASASSGSNTGYYTHGDPRATAVGYKNETQQSHDTDRELNVIHHNTSFEDAHGELPRRKESSSRSSGTRQHFFPDTPAPKAKADSSLNDMHYQQKDGILHKPLSELLPIPSGYDEWIIPSFCQTLHLPTSRQLKKIQQQKLLDSSQQLSSGPILDRTHVLPSPILKGQSSPSSMGVEAMYISPLSSPTVAKMDLGAPRSHYELEGDNGGSMNEMPDPSVIPSIVPWKAVPTAYNGVGNSEYVYIPILAIRRQRVGEEERYHEDPAVIDLQLSCLNLSGMPPFIPDDDDEDENKPMMQHGSHSVILKRSPWIPCLPPSPHRCHLHPIILVRRNVANGFADLSFPARVLDRFPQKNYRDMPFPEEELPMFCYARGSLLKRDKLRNLPIPKSFGFVVKNERGDSIYVFCLAFLEPLTRRRQRELDELSNRMRRTSLPHRRYWQRTQSKRPNGIFDKCHMVAFDDVVSFESKTICLVGRYPFWTAFRQFLSHLHLLSGLSSDTPLERHISHLLLSVPLPKPGGQCVLIPTSTMREPMALLMPPLKDLPLLDLSYKMLFSALDVPTVVTIVLGFLCLEKKVIMISSRQSLVLDCCELLKSLLFPFELCAPYVPHLTEPFVSCLEFPGATFVGIHDDGDSNGLASTVRQTIPEDSIIVELDNGEIKSDGNRYETLKAAYQIIPSDSRSALIKEVESLCQDAGIIPGQEPLDYSIDSLIDSTVPSNLAETFGAKNGQNQEPLDDRAVRDCFLRFFCSILGGYERYLVVPDADFLISGNDWFDSSKFLAAAPSTRGPFLGSLVSTQLFQSFIQRRTEASDVHLVLFDECVAEYHSSKMPYGLRGNGDLLVDQCATEPDILLNDDDSYIDKSEIADKPCSQAGSDTATHASFDSEIQFALNGSGDIVTVPTVLPNQRFAYCVDGHPSFPTKLHRSNFLPKEPEHLSTDFNELPVPILTRSDREREEATRLLNTTISRRGPQKQHRCLWQLPKFMGSQFLGAWLMCIPSQLTQPGMTLNDKSSVLLRALGALRTLRSHRRIIADEAAYRALIVACGKCGSDRRIELMKLYGLMRTDGIFPNAVTLGQYTKSIAEGYSRKDAQSKVGMQISVNASKAKAPFDLSILDSNLQILEESGHKWRSQGNSEAMPTGAEVCKSSLINEKSGKPSHISPAKTFDTATTTQRQSKHKRMWLPITCSSSFHISSGDESGEIEQSIRLVALWSRTVSCDSCQYTPLDEEVQCGWDIAHSTEDSPVIFCPRCGSSFVPLIGFKHITLSEALTGPHSLDDDLNSSRDCTADDLPPQLEATLHHSQVPSVSIKDQSFEGFVSYLSPYKLRIMLEQLVEEYGEEILSRERLLVIDPQVFYNLWWYCARFSLPLPLAIAAQETAMVSNCCAFASWDKSVAMHGCQSAARAIAAAESLHHRPDRAIREKLFDNPHTDMPILSFFNFQNYAQSDWEHPDLSEVLVALVKACETRDLLPVIECVFQRNLIRNQKRESCAKNGLSPLNSSFESAGSVNFSIESIGSQLATTELDCYCTVLYLARYQCMTAFHAFFPTCTKACKGYHFWCPSTPWSIFDRAFREAAQEYGKKHKMIVPIPDVSDVAIGFRSIFGQVI